MDYEKLIGDYKEELKTLHSTFDTELDAKLTAEKQKLEEVLKTRPTVDEEHVTKLEGEIQVGDACISHDVCPNKYKNYMKVRSASSND